MDNLEFKRLSIYLILTMSLVLFGCPCSIIDEPIEETENTTDFISGADGWTIEGDAHGGEGLIPEFSDVNGLDNSGYIFAKDDVAGGVWYFVAPEKYLGNKSAFFNGMMRYWLIQKSARTYQFLREDVIIEGISNERIVINLPMENFPDTIWTKYQFTFNESEAWVDENNQAATNQKIKSVLSNVTKLKIRGEFEGGPDTGGLDGFALIK